MFLSFCLFFSAFAFVAFSVVSPCSSDLLFVRAACVLIFAASLLFSPLVAFVPLENAETRRQAVLVGETKKEASDLAIIGKQKGQWKAPSTGKYRNNTTHTRTSSLDAFWAWGLGIFVVRLRARVAPQAKPSESQPATYPNHGQSRHHARRLPRFKHTFTSVSSRPMNCAWRWSTATINIDQP